MHCSTRAVLSVFFFFFNDTATTEIYTLSLHDALPICFVRWIWDGEVCGSIGYRWQPGTPTLPPHVLGHIGFSVVPWKRRQGLASKALAMMLEEPRQRGLPYVEVTTTPDNLASQGVIQANGGVLVERFNKLPAYGGGETLRFRIPLD